MKPPEGYSKAQPHQVCKLKKSLYGLKQASRKWNQELTKFLVTLGYTQSKHDYSQFTKGKDEQFTAILVYVDDVLVTGNCISEIMQVKVALLDKFTIKDQCIAKYFLDIELAQTSTGTHLR